jgi:putative transcription factor
MNPHQDWNRVVLTANAKPKKGEKAMSEAMRRGQDVESLRRQSGNAQHDGPNIRRLAEETDVPQVVTVGHEFGQMMMKARMEMNLKQQDLALRINEKQTVVKDYESGKAVPNPSVILKIERALNVHLPRNRPERARKEEEDR